MSECNHNCSSCSSNCSERQNPEDLLAKQNDASNIKKVIAVVSGKGGVGKSLVTSLSAIAARRNGQQVGILDADITGPSIAQIFNIDEPLLADENYTYPAESNAGIKLVSTNLILQDPTDPVIWRGPILAGLVKQFYTEVAWGDLDYLFVDCPPGTGDVPLTIFQSLPISGIIIVTTPQDLVSMIVSKAIKMANMMNIPIMGVIENMSYIKCNECGNKISVFGESHVKEFCAENDLKLLAQLPIEPTIAAACDQGVLENINSEAIDQLQNIYKQ